MTQLRSTNSIEWDDKLTPKLAALPEYMHNRIAAVMDYNANEAQNYMRVNAPWTDRTGNARQGLFAKPFREPGRHIIVCYHTMPYGIWLEVRWAGKYEIINPTIRNQGKKVMQDLRSLLR